MMLQGGPVDAARLRGAPGPSHRENSQLDELPPEMRKKGENRGFAAVAYCRWRRGGAGWIRCREGAL
jgi:hypothetical protein